MTQEKKKINTRKIIYRKLRESKSTKKNVAKMVSLAVLMAAITLVIPGICTGVELPARPDHGEPIIQNEDIEPNIDSEITEPEDQDIWQPKPLSVPSGISGQSTSTYHV
ncbi:MAG: hypothetical protein KAJ33_08640 [Thermoplasmata archaeon]|nr:hypothetical protein [Thermoplasmata archaeon]